MSQLELFLLQNKVSDLGFLDLFLSVLMGEKEKLGQNKSIC